jgi:hypothetical protein
VWQGLHACLDGSCTMVCIPACTIGGFAGGLVAALGELAADGDFLVWLAIHDGVADGCDGVCLYGQGGPFWGSCWGMPVTAYRLS